MTQFIFRDEGENNLKKKKETGIYEKICATGVRSRFNWDSPSAVKWQPAVASAVLQRLRDGTGH